MKELHDDLGISPEIVQSVKQHLSKAVDLAEKNKEQAIFYVRAAVSGLLRGWQFLACSTPAKLREMSNQAQAITAGLRELLHNRPTFPLRGKPSVLEIPSFDDFPAFLDSENSTPASPSWGRWGAIQITTINEPFDEDDYLGDSYYETQQQPLPQAIQAAAHTEVATTAKDDCHPATIHTASRIQEAVGSGSPSGNEFQRGGTGHDNGGIGILSKFEQPRRDYGQGQIAQHHFQEWLASGVDPQIIKLNVRSLSREEIFQHLNLSNLSERELWQYKNILKGGWTCGNEFKPDYPRTFPGKSTPTKYENPREQKVEPLLLKLPDEIWQAIATKYGVEKPIDIDGWEWVKQHPEIPVVIVEGAKKAGSVITSQLIPAIALPGHTAAYHKDGDVRFPEFVHSERTIYLAFDNEYVTQKRRDVNTTIQGVINRIIKFDEKTATKTPLAKLKICQWRNDKGIDDVLITHGDKTVKTIFDSALNWHDWVDDSFQALGFKPSVVFNSPKFQFVELPEKTHLIGVIAPKGSGKTWYMEQLVQQAIAAKRPILSIVHRIQLGLSLANRLGLTYIDDIDGKVVDANKVSLVADSLAKIDPEKFAGGLILIDEVVQTLEHLMCGDTCKTKREKILKTLRQLGKVIVNTNAQLVIADADLNEATLRFFIGLLGDTNINPYIIENQYREKSYTCYVSQGYQNTSENGNLSNPCPADIIATLITYAQSGQRVLLCTTGQKELAKWGTSNCEKMLLAHGITDIIRIDSDTVKNPDHPAYRAISKINQLCDTYQIVIGSPSMATGISIENKNSFDLVCGIFTGVGSADATRQFLMRLRDVKAPRLIYVTNEGVDTTYSNLGTTPEAVDLKSGELFSLEKAVLTRHDHEWMGEYPDINCCNSASNYFNNLIASRNKETDNYRNYVKHGLRSEGVEIIDIPDAGSVFPTSVSFAEIYEEAKEVKNNSVEFYYQKLAAQQEKLLSDEEYAELKKQKDFTDPERIALEAKILSNRYGGIEVTEELATKDADGFYKKLRLHYACTVGYDLVKNTQTFSANKHLTAGEGSVLRHDFVERQKLIAQTDFIKDSGLLTLLDKEELSAQDPDCANVFKFCAENKQRIDLLFNHKLKKVTADKFSFKVIQIMLDLLALQSKQLTQKRNAGEKVNIYSAIAPCVTIDKESKDVTLEQDEREQIFAAWLERDTERAKLWEKRKRDWEIKRLVSRCTEDVDLEYFRELRQQEIFSDMWEHVHTTTRIKIINRVDSFTLPKAKGVQIIPSTENYQACLADLATWTKFAIDLETYGNDAKNKEGLHPAKGEIRLIQISNGQTIYWVDLGGRESDKSGIQNSLKEFLQLLNKLISDPNVLTINQNIHFDLRFLRFRLGFDRARNIVDTMKGAQIFFGDYPGIDIDKENKKKKTPPVLPGGYGLGNLGEKLLGLEIDKTEQKSDWGAPLTQSQIDYAIRDPFVTYHLWLRLEQLYQDPIKFGFGKLAQDGVREAWQLEDDVIPCAVEIESNGVPIERIEANNLLDRCKAIQSQLLEHWKNLVPEIDYTQNSKLKDILNKKYSLQIKSLNKSQIAELNNLDEIKLLSQLRAIKIPIQQLESLLRSSERTGRIQTVFNTLTGTGRFSSGNSKTFNDLPNLQSIGAKAHPALKEFGLPGIRTVIKPVGEPTHILVDKKSILKTQTEYQKLKKGIPEVERDYLDMCQVFFDIALNLNTLNFIDKIEALEHLQSWKDNKAFIKKYDLPGLESTVKILGNRTLAVIDLAGAHGRIAADVANDETAIAGNNDESIDNHSKVAVHVAAALGKDGTWEEIKKGAKSGNAEFKLFRDAAKNTYYGWLNGAGAKRIQEQIKSNSGQIVALEACEGAIKGCEALYPQVVEFRKNLIAELSNKDNLLYVDGKYYAVNKIASVNNRITHLVTVDDDKVDLPYTQCLAAIWSRTEATALKRALIQITDLAETHPEWDLKVVNYVHDEINIEFNTEHAEDVVTTVNNIIGDCFQATMSKVKDGRETNWTKLVVENWSQK